MPTTILAAIKLWHIHPIVDHFTIALLTVGVLIDLVGSLFPGYRWMRYTALIMMILGATAAAGSTLTGGWEAHKVWDSTTGPAKEILHRHAEFGDKLAWVFGALAVWRILIEVLGFVAGTRPIYLIVAVIAVGFLGYQGYTGGEIVYDYGVGTAIYGGGAASTRVTPPAPMPTSIPTVYVPTPSPKPTAAATASATATVKAPTASASATPAPAPPAASRSAASSSSPSPVAH